MKAEERAELRKRHQQSTLHIDGVDVRTFDACRHCEDVSWPCDVVLLLDALEAAEASSIPIGNRDDSMEDMEATIAWGEAEVARLKAALEAAEAENERLRAMLARHGRHDPYCGATTGGNGSGACSCGLVAP